MKAVLKAFEDPLERWREWLKGRPWNTVQTTLIFYFGLLIVAPLLVLGIITYTVSSRTITGRVQTYVEQIIIKVKENIEYYFRDLQSLSYVISVNQDILAVLGDETGLDRWKEIAYQNKLKTFLAGLTSTRSEVTGIYLLSRNQRKIYSSGPPVLLSHLKRQGWFNRIIRSEVGVVISGAHSDDYVGQMLTPANKVVTYAQRIVDLDGQKDLGWILIDLDYAFVTKMLENIQLWDQGRIAILDSGRRVIYGEAQDARRYLDKSFDYLTLRDWGSYLQKIGNRTELLVFQTAAPCGWKVLFMVPYHILQRENLFIRNLTLGMALCLLLVSIYFAVLFSRKISGPIKLLCSSMREVENNNLDVSLKLQSMNEFNELAASHNHMVKEIKTLMSGIYEAQKKKRQAELNVLQAQINPHFLYNTLDSLRWLAKIRQVEEISDIISALENLLRASIGKNDDLIPIDQEVENVRNFLAILLFRYGNSFTVEYAIDPKVAEFLAPRFILQPIVENAVYHGLDGVLDGRLRIGIAIEAGVVRFEVIDNGPGIEPERARLVMEGKVGSDHRFSGLGIKNVDERIKLNFGPDYGLQIENIKPSGTRVTIRIPCTRRLGKRKPLQ
ncbi:two-component system sensor histidine kinase YesM [Hydrogenispora ethanolica]|uniref:histidine kinase n=1 Tax=Hydrogenispora ethanolica TaxID=1082276 RepID=A0A4R1RW08_HYDET|nr:sensor histidine kinase [Hydrogenispora ethanolica]TCL70863.1 two-component system sensor histidine kinase YesM [Hydrogenispora ethanolica]